jgi:membrane protein implicated in regulation of membrane protease activity
VEVWLIWLLSGVVLSLLELIIPGGIIVFVGVAGIIVSLLIKFGFITNLVTSFIIWFILSIIFMFVLRSFFMKFFEGETFVENTSEDEDAKGAIVEIVETIFPYKEGRIRFRGSSWKARSEKEIKKGDKGVIIERDQSVWIVKPF